MISSPIVPDLPERHGGNDKDLPGKFSIETVLELRGERDLFFGGFRVRMSSLRYQLFAQSLDCAACGIKGSFFLLRYNGSKLEEWRGRAHFNLWAECEDGTLMLMTKDHIVPHSRGGKNYLGNLQTMCARCNECKADG